MLPSKRKEFTDDEIERIGVVYSKIHELVQLLEPHSPHEEVEWDMEFIGEIADVIWNYLDSQHICTEQEFYPFIKR